MHTQTVGVIKKSSLVALEDIIYRCLKGHGFTSYITLKPHDDVHTQHQLTKALASLCFSFFFFFL